MSILWIIFAIWVIFALGCVILAETTENEIFGFALIISMPLMFYIPFFFIQCLVFKKKQTKNVCFFFGQFFRTYYVRKILPKLNKNLQFLKNFAIIFIENKRKEIFKNVSIPKS